MFEVDLKYTQVCMNKGFCIENNLVMGAGERRLFSGFSCTCRMTSALKLCWRCSPWASVVGLVLCVWPQLSQLGVHSWLFLLALGHSTMLMYAFSFSFYFFLFYSEFLFFRIFTGSSLGPGLRVGSSEEESPLLLLELNLLLTLGSVETQLSAESVSVVLFVWGQVPL